MGLHGNGLDVLGRPVDARHSKVHHLQWYLMAEEWVPKDPDNLKYHLAVTLDSFQKPVSPLTVLRVSRKVFGGVEAIDLRLWGLTKDGKTYPKKGKGICMLTSNWKVAMQIFNENNLLSNVPITNS